MNGVKDKEQVFVIDAIIRTKIFETAFCWFGRFYREIYICLYDENVILKNILFYTNNTKLVGVFDYSSSHVTFLYAFTNSHISNWFSSFCYLLVIIYFYFYYGDSE